MTRQQNLPTNTAPTPRNWARSARLPDEAQEIFRATFNSAWASYRNRPTKEREEIAHRVAWAIVKRQYRKVGDEWIGANKAEEM